MPGVELSFSYTVSFEFHAWSEKPFYGLFPSPTSYLSEEVFGEYATKIAQKGKPKRGESILQDRVFPIVLRKEGRRLDRICCTREKATAEKVGLSFRKSSSERRIEKVNIQSCRLLSSTCRKPSELGQIGFVVCLSCVCRHRATAPCR